MAALQLLIKDISKAVLRRRFIYVFPLSLVIVLFSKSTIRVLVFIKIIIKKWSRIINPKP